MRAAACLRRVGAPFLLVLCAACSSGGEKQIPDYFSARINPPLKIPEGLGEPQRSRTMELPEAAFDLQPPADTDLEELLQPPRIIDDAAS